MPKSGVRAIHTRLIMRKLRKVSVGTRSTASQTPRPVRPATQNLPRPSAAHASPSPALTDYTAEKVRTICTGLEDLRARWADATERAAIIELLADRGIDFHAVATQAGKPDADLFDLLCHLAFNAPACHAAASGRKRPFPAKASVRRRTSPAEASARRRMLTRRQRADRVKKQQAAFFTYYAPEAREILNELLEKYAADGELQFTLPDVLKVEPICRKFGGPDELRKAVTQLQTLLYAA